MTKNIIFTGAMGSGKSTVLNLLKAHKVTVVAEPAREILAEQRSIGGEGVPEKNPQLFTELLLSRAMFQYKQMQGTDGTVIYDRGIPDNIAYADLFKLDFPHAYRAAKLVQYHPQVFIFPAWKQIYATDDERKMSFEAAKEFGDSVAKIYNELGYHLIELPCVSAEERLQFVLESIK
jgi:predicted ATPase